MSDRAAFAGMAFGICVLIAASIGLMAYEPEAGPHHVDVQDQP